MKRADFQRLIDEEKKSVECFLCAHNCHIKEGKRGSGGDYLYNTYKWNTPKLQLDVQSSFYYSNDKSKDSIYVRLWMNKK